VKKVDKTDTSPLRRRAEERLKAERPAAGLPVREADRERLLQELQAHQIELEMQNEELRGALLELEKAKDKYADFYDFAPVGYLTFTEKGMIAELNLAAAGLLGIERKHLVNRPFHRFVKSELQDAFHRHRREALESSRKQTCELELKRNDGAFFHAQLHSISVDIEGQRSIRTVVTDITERKQMERKLEESERLYRAIGESINYGVWVCAPDGRNIYASESFLKMVGLTQEECSSFGWGDVLHPDDAERTIAAWKECIRTEGIWDMEHRFRGVDGQYHYVLARGVPVRDEHGQITCWAGINLDIDHLKQMQEDLRQSRDELELRVRERTQELQKSGEISRAQHMEIEAYYNMTPIGLCILSKELRFVRVNERLSEIDGLPVSVHLGRTIREVVPAVADMAEETARRVIETGEPVSNVEFTGETADRPGISRTIRATWFPLKDAHGQIASIGVMAEEITEQRRLEEQLRQSQKMEAIGTLAGGIAHDFNNLLAAIIGFAEMVEEDIPQDSPSMARIRRVLSAAFRGRDLVRHILAFSRKTELARKRLSLSPLVDETAQLLRASLPATINIELTSRVAKDTILASPAEVQQILMNLSTNASFAMREKGGILGISISNIDFEPDFPVLDAAIEPGEYVQLTVTDTGDGMTQDVMKRAFDPFFTTKGVEEGTGMGLAVVYGVVKSLGGTIAVESEPGAGSTFRVFLPITQTDEKAEDSKVQVTPKGSERILFVDDEELLMEWGQAALERLGYTVTALTDSTEALNLFSSDPSRFDLIILDQTMPKLTGLHLAQKLLTIRNNIPIILCTGHSDTVSPEKAKEAGIKEFLMKPLGKQDLAEAIRKVLDSTGSQD
jgi:PAS domain S-box-containing protein